MSPSSASGKGVDHSREHHFAATRFGLTTVSAPSTLHDGLELTPPRRRAILVALAVLQVVVITGAAALAWPLRSLLSPYWSGEGLPGGAFSTVYGPWVILIWIASLLLQGTFSPRHLAPDLEEIRAMVRVSIGSLAFTGFTVFLFDETMPRAFLLLTYLIGLPALLLVHFGVRKFVHRARAQGHLRHRVLAVGSPSAVAELNGILIANSYAGYEIVGACAPEELDVADADYDVPLLGTVRDVGRLQERIDADTVMVAGGGLSSAADLRRIGWDLEGTDTRLIVAPSVVDIAGQRMHMRLVAGLPLVHVEEPQVSAAGGLVKRIFDFAVASALLLLLSPVMAAVALAVKLGDRGPVMFKQQRPTPILPT